MKFNLLFSYLFFIAFVLNPFAQDKGNVIELKIILSNIEKQHLVTFNYLETDISSFKMIPPTKEVTLKNKLQYVSQNSNLQFHFATENYIAIIANHDIKICGYLIDAETNEKIENASVHFNHSDTFALSDQKGYFELTYNSSNTIEVSHLGYKKMYLEPLELKKNDCSQWLLEPNSNQLKEVIAQVYLTKGISKNSDGSFEIQPKKFSILPGLTEPDVFQTMQQLPGINSIDQTISNINVRGGSHDQNLFLWNEIRLFQTGHFYGLISILNPNLPNKIKIIKNGSSAFYGESVSSTISITTQTTNHTGAIGLNLINIDFNKSFSLSKKASLTISGRRSYTDFLRSPTYNNYFERIFQNTVVSSVKDNQNIDFTTDANFYFYDTSIQFDQKINEKNKLQINFITISNQLNFNQSKIENNNAITKNSSLDQQSFGGSLLFKRNWNTKNNSLVTIYASNYKVDSRNESINGNQIFTQENTVLDTGFHVEHHTILNPFFTFKNGYQFHEIGIRNTDQINSPSFFRNTKEVLHNHALISELEYFSKNKKLESSFGIRNNFITPFNSFILEPRFRFNYQLSNLFSTQILAEKKHQTTTQIIDLQQDFLGVEKRRWILVNNQDIPIIKSDQVAVGFTFKKQNWLFSVDNFYKKVTGITTKSQGFQNQLEFENRIGNYTTIGSELLIQKQINDFTSWISYTISQNTYDFKMFNPEKFPNNFDIQHNVSFGIVYHFDAFKIAFGSRWFTGRPTTFPLNNTIQDNTITYQNPNSDRLPNFFQTNISAGYTFSFSEKKQLQVGASIQNLFNNQNILNQYFRINTNTNSIEKVNTYALKITPNIYLRYSF
ncbi:carboxypeptidase-like regulatory domain-containing protein [Flavobacterium sp. J27]|uniref:TonB-dependent receptor n=1 Tax=Flavobacterium sp. J27 TaxID=2060419 RepID=UPI0010309834|nr:carboxypeptidase-like regulatory domain-containing protein [Flavobacterium sp. J27]